MLPDQSDFYLTLQPQVKCNLLIKRQSEPEVSEWNVPKFQVSLFFCIQSRQLFTSLYGLDLTLQDWGF